MVEINIEGSSFSASEDILSHPSPQWIKYMFEPFLDSIQVGIFVLDCDGIIKRVNKCFLEQYRWEPEDLVGQNIFEMLPDLVNLGVKNRFHNVINLRQSMELTNLTRKDRFGRDIVLNLKAMPILEGNTVIGVLAITNDISEKRALESQIAETGEYLRNLIDNANDIIYTLDNDGYITFLNIMGQEVTGYRFIQGERAHYSAYVPQKTLQEHERHVRDALKGKPQRYESTILSYDERITNVLINITPIRRGEQVVGVLGIARDITERKQMEAQLLQAGKMAAIGELAAGVAHEINNPVAIISGTAEQLLFLIDHYRKRPEEMAEKLAKHVGIIHEQAARCKKITQGLLNFARKTETRKTPVDLSKLIEETLALVENRALNEGKRIVVDLDPTVPLLEADPHQLEQVFLNLVNNALDAINTNGTVTFRSHREEHEIVIDIIDNGAGIPEQHLKKIFDPFFTTKRIGKGTGLGLSICFGIIQSMNGGISVKSKPRAGTTFSVRLPIGKRKHS
jgi:two-component system NtrC family sensor kinase